MRRSLGLPCVVLLAACAALASCSELRRSSVAGAEAEEPGAEEEGEEGGGGGAKDGGASAPRDAGTDDGDAKPPACDGPCPPELLGGIYSVGSSMSAIAVDDENVYFATEGTTRVYQCPKTGCVGGPILLGEGAAYTIVVVSGRVYWADFSSGKILSCAVGGCGGQPTTVVASQPSIRDLSTDEANLVWSTSAANGAVRWCAIGATCTAADVITNVGSVRTVAVHQGAALWSSSTTKGIRTCALGSCSSPKTLGPGGVDVSARAGHAFWIDNEITDSIVSCNAAGCGGSPKVIGTSPIPASPASDATHVYWRDEGDRRIYRCPTSGCTPGGEIIARSQRCPAGVSLALDSSFVYWTTDDEVYRMPKP